MCLYCLLIIWGHYGGKERSEGGGVMGKEDPPLYRNMPGTHLLPLYIADRAYTLFDGLVLQKSHRFQLSITPHGNKDPVPNAPIFQINHLPSSITNEGLYSLFRPFGPIRLCKIIVEKDASFNGTALLQYFEHRHAENAKKIMVCIFI